MWRSHDQSEMSHTCRDITAEGPVFVSSPLSRPEAVSHDELSQVPPPRLILKQLFTLKEKHVVVSK